jgi:3-oxoacyl-ACP reductase-like protein
MVVPTDVDRCALLERLSDTTELLEAIAADRSVLAGVPDAQRARLLQAVARVYHPDRAERRRMAKTTARQRKAARVKDTEQARFETGIRELRRKPVFHSPNVFPPEQFAPQDIHEGRAATESQHCYVCKQHFTLIHHFYDQLCPDCAGVNFRKRTELANLSGRVALVTGGRVKIGYQAALKLLRSGAHVIVTTRFPRDSAQRYAREADFADWGHRLEIFALDLRHTPSVEAFCRELLATRTRLDFIVNNACQTVRRPPDFYRHMM